LLQDKIDITLLSNQTERNESSYSGAVGARLSTDASTVKSLVGDTLALIVQNISTITAGLILAFTSNWILAFIVLAVSPVVLIQGIIQMQFLKGFSGDAKVLFLFVLSIKFRRL